MSSSDFKDVKRTNVVELLPEVYRSDFNKSFLDASINKLLTPDTSHRKSGYVGNVRDTSRQVVESTYFRQANQLQPVVVNSPESGGDVLTFSNFASQLKALNVDFRRMDDWGKANQFNWAPPINLDKLLNYQDYYWNPPTVNQPADYITIENIGRQMQDKVASYRRTLDGVGAQIPMIGFNVQSNTLIVSGYHTSLFHSGFVFYLLTQDVVFNKKYWTAISSSYDIDVDQTSIVVREPFGSVVDTIDHLVGAYVGELAFSVSANVTYRWDGTSWKSTQVLGLKDYVVSLTELLDLFQAEADCANNVSRWDTGLFDNNSSIVTIAWSASILSSISFLSEADWESSNGSPTVNSLWYNTSRDELYAYGTEWKLICGNFSTIINRVNNNESLEAVKGCIEPILNDWSKTNYWQHKTQISSFVGASGAQLPIIEYSENVELANWVGVSHTWKYRALDGGAFNLTTTSPTSLELSPIANYQFIRTGNVVDVYLLDDGFGSYNKNLTNVFYPGFSFVLEKLSEKIVYSTIRSVYRTLTSLEKSQLSIDATQLFDQYVTIVTIQDDSELFSYGRIRPLLTSVGDAWLGETEHWLLFDITTSPTTPSRKSVLMTSQSTSLSAVSTGTIKVSRGFQELTVSVPVSEVMFDAMFLPVPSSNQVDAVGSHVVRLRDNYTLVKPGNTITLQHGSNIKTYSVSAVTSTPTHTDIQVLEEILPSPTFFYGGNVSYAIEDNIRVYRNGYRETSGFDLIKDGGYVVGVSFDSDLNALDRIRIEICPASADEMDLACVPVRTIESDDDFKAALLEGTQPTLMNVQSKKLYEQIKRSPNQYPLFNVYSISTGQVIAANSIFGYAESASAELNRLVSKRIVTADVGNYEFTLPLLDSDTGPLRAYRNVRLNTDALWYNPQKNTIKVWSGDTWDSKFYATIDGLGVESEFYVGSNQPSFHYYWYNPSTNVHYFKTAGTWVEGDTRVVVSDVDPSIETVWKQSENTPLYVPQFVDDQGKVTEEYGDWEFPKQWFNNPSHKNRTNINLRELDAHIRSIIDSQPAVSGHPYRGYYTLSSSQFDYGVGGTIKEFGGSYDMLISAINSTSTNPVAVIEFARDQYDTLTTMLLDTTKSSIVDVLTTSSILLSTNLEKAVVTHVERKFEANSFLSSVYGDSSAQHAPFWISTLPVFGFGEPTLPFANNINLSTHVIKRHDGTYFTVNLTSSDNDIIVNGLLSREDSRAPGFSYCAVGFAPPTLTSHLEAVLGNIRPNIYFHSIGGGVSQMYQLSILSASAYHPSAVGIEEGQKYYNTQNRTLYVLSGGMWTVVTSVGDGIIESAWKPFSFSSLFVATVLDVEMKLYNSSTNRSEFFAQEVKRSSAELFDERMNKRFMDYVVSHNIVSPYTNTEYNSINSFTWNFSNGDIPVPPTSRPQIRKGCWQALYEYWFNTPYPNIEPWTMQGYASRPTWWFDEYLDSTGVYKWKRVGTLCPLWENIKLGIVPAGYNLPSGIVSTGATGEVQPYLYVPINTTANHVGVFKPDDILPPYLAPNSAGLRSLFTDYSDVVQPSSDYSYGDEGPVEWQWRSGSAYLYDELITAFEIQPVETFGRLFDTNYFNVGGLYVNASLEKVLSHKNIIFHGQPTASGSAYEARGLNQWYVNYMRYTGHDLGLNFYKRWTSWDMKLSYLTGGFVDVDAIQISTKRFDVELSDYSVDVVNIGTLADMWVDAINVSALHIPPKIVQHNNENKWKFSITTNHPTSRELAVYGVKKYCAKFDVDRQILKANVVDIVGVVPGVLIVAGDLRMHLEITQFVTSIQSGVLYQHQIRQLVFDSASNMTRVSVTGVTASLGELYIDVDVGIGTGDLVLITSDKFLPYPLKRDEAVYAIKTGFNQYKFAVSQNDALLNNSIVIGGENVNGLFVGKVATTFSAFNSLGQSKEMWYHYEIDKSRVRLITTPYEMTGIQNIIDFVDGVVERKQDTGVDYKNNEFRATDPETGRYYDWQYELEKMIESLYRLRTTKLQVVDKYAVSVSSIPDNILSFNSSAPKLADGTAVVVRTTGQPPSPLQTNVVYYLVNVGVGEFKLSFVPRATTSTIIDIQDVGSGDIFISLSKPQENYPTYELNPSRYSQWLSTPHGILSDVTKGPYDDIRTKHTIYDQFGKVIPATNLLIYRYDSSSLIQSVGTNANGEYQQIGGMHLFVEGYEQAIVFNNYTSGGSLVYDDFLGIKHPNFEVDLVMSAIDTKRPSFGGYYQSGHKFIRNIEGQLNDLRISYDTHVSREQRNMTKYAHNILGYRNGLDFLDSLNANPKTKLLFYRGMVKNKGTVDSISAYVNHRMFEDAEVDECWAYKVAEYGALASPATARVKIKTSDVYVDDIRYTFDIFGQFSPEYVESQELDGYDVLSIRDQSRWLSHPNLLASDGENYSFLQADTEFKVEFYISPHEPTSPISVPWYNPLTDSFRTFDGSSWLYVQTPYVSSRYVRLPTHVDAVVCFNKRTTAGNVTNFLTEELVEGNSTNQYQKISSNIVRIGADVEGFVVLYGKLYNGKNINTVRIVNRTTDTVEHRLYAHNPLSGLYNPTSVRDIDRWDIIDPAEYTNPLGVPTSTRPWGLADVGCMWIDSSQIGFEPYLNSFLYSSETERTQRWGRLADWASYNVYEWVVSAVLPTQYVNGTPRQVLYRRTRRPNDFQIVDGRVSVHHAPEVEYNEGDVIIFSSAYDLPAAVSAEVRYVVQSPSQTGQGTVFDVREIDSDDTVVFAEDYTSVGMLVLAFDAQDWQVCHLAHQTFDVLHFDTTKPFECVVGELFDSGDVVEVWKNNLTLIGLYVVDDTKTIVTEEPASARDFFTVVKQQRTLTDDELSFDPDDEDDGTIHTQYKYDIPYSTCWVPYQGMLVERYCFWASGTTTQTTKQPSLVIRNGLYDDTRPHVIFLDLERHQGELKYSRMVLRNISSIVDGDESYEMRISWSRDLKMNNTRSINGEIHKNRHKSWKIVHPAQIGVIDRFLWDKLTESMAGETLDGTKRVPSLTREAFDDTYGEHTRYGLEDGQTFMDGQLAKDIIVNYLETKGKELNPHDAAYFLDKYPFDTATNVKRSMDVLYTMFSAKNINEMWFECLNGAISLNPKYSDIMKTSWLVVHNIRLLNVDGIQDE